MAQITFTIDNEKIVLIISAMNGLYPIPQINTGTEEDPVWENEFTNAAWAKECIRRWVIKQVARWIQGEAIKEITYSEDNLLLQ